MKRVAGGRRRPVLMGIHQGYSLQLGQFIGVSIGGRFRHPCSRTGGLMVNATQINGVKNGLDNALVRVERGR